MREGAAAVMALELHRSGRAVSLVQSHPNSTIDVDPSVKEVTSATGTKALFFYRTGAVLGM